MKTLHLTNSWHAASGGIATFYQALMEAANRRGHEMRMVVPGREDRVEAVGAHACIYYVASPPAPVNREYRIILPTEYVCRGSRLRKIVEEERPDLVEICDKYTLNYFAGMLRVGMMGDIHCRPVVAGLSCERMDDNVRAYFGWNPLARTLAKFYMKWLYFCLFDHHLANSQYTAEELRPASMGHATRRGVWIRPMGVDSEDFSPAHRSSLARCHLRQRTRAVAGAKLLLYVGRLAPEKNLRLLLEVLERLEEQRSMEWCLVLIGDGAERRRFLNEANRRTPRRVAWLGHVQNRAELARIYANCDVLVHPNPREPFGIAPLEAMASGLPVIAPNVGGVTTYANSTNAWLVPPEADEFAKAIRDACRVSAERDLRVTRALATASQFRWENVADSFLDLYQDLAQAAQTTSYRFPADFFSSAPDRGGSAAARFTTGLARRLLSTR